MSVDPPALSLRGLSRHFGGEPAVHRLTLDVGRGELFAMVGPDGSGKTTTLRMLAGVMKPTEGDALVCGESVVENPEAVKHNIAYMAQRFGLYTDLTVRENIHFYADLYGVSQQERPARIKRLYAFSHLGPFEHRLAGDLSGGMKQKLSLCCALIHRPQVMLLDEPTFGVDPISRRDLWLIIHQMVADGTTVFLSTAYMDEAERCDRVALLHHGRIVAMDTPTALQSRLEGRIVAVQTDAPRQTRDLLKSLPPVHRATLFGESVHAIVNDAATDWPVAERALASSGIKIVSTKSVKPSLEDVFIDFAADTEDQHV